MKVLTEKAELDFMKRRFGFTNRMQHPFLFI